MSTEPAVAPSGSPSLPIRVGHFFFGRRDFVFLVVFVAIALLDAPRPFLRDPAADLWLDLAGFAISLTGQILRALVIGLAYIRRGGKDRKIYADTLVTEGVFAHSRNPLYLGNMLVYFGLFVMLNSPTGYLVGVPFFVIAYLCITVAEEDFLRGRFGAQYEEYCRRVPRFFPVLQGLGKTVSGMRFDWKRVVRKEYGTTAAWLTAVAAVLVRENVAWHGAAASAPTLRMILVAYALVAVLYVVARWMKKTKRLAD